jgi:hypothetical protein
MAQSIHAANDGPLYSYDASNASAAFEAPATAATSFLQSKVVWAFGIIVAFVLARILTQRQKLPAGVKRLPKIPGTRQLSSRAQDWHNQANNHL